MCHTRINREGTLYTLIYGQVSAMHIAPMEIKPLFHFHPGTRALSFGSLSCNFRCIHCQNWEIAHRDPDQRATEYISPGRAVALAQKLGCEGLCWTYNEPTIWLEYTIDSAQLAKQAGLHTSYVTNGFITPEALDAIGPYLDAFRVDVKGFRREFYQQVAKVSDFSGILEVAERAKHQWGVHVEVVTNIIPGFNDDPEQLRDLANWIVQDLGPDTPWHVTQFVPHLKLSHLSPTPVATLEKARYIGLEAGLRFVYLGNVPGHPAENTYCPECGELLIKRFNYSVLRSHIKGKRCGFCGAEIPIVGQIKVGKKF